MAREKGKEPLRAAVRRLDAELGRQLDHLWDEAEKGVQQAQRSKDGHQQGTAHCQRVEENLSAEGELSAREREDLLAEARSWGKRFCRRCEYCLPECPNDINITLTLLFAAYSKRYGLKEWARERYAAMPVKADVCEECGKCEAKCPYGLPVIDMLREAHEELSG